MRLRPKETLAGLPPGSQLSPERQTARLAMHPLSFMEELRAEYGNIFTVRMLHEPPWVLVSDPALIKSVFLAPADVLHAGEGKRFLRPILGDNSLLLLDEDAHMEQRKLLLPPFSGGYARHYEKVIRRTAEKAVDEWPLGVEKPATTLTRAIALEVIVGAVFGVEASERLAPLRDALRSIQPSGNANRSRSPGFREAIERIDELIYAEISRAGGDVGAAQGEVLSLLLGARHEDGSPMSELEVRDEIMTLLWAGYETTAATLAWALERLSRHPEPLARVSEEAVEGGGPYTDAAIKETLRLRPAIPIVAREVMRPFPLGDHVVPAGAVIGPAPLLVHHRPDIYPEPTAFRPERFLDSTPDPHAWIPFGGGPRRCIGAGFALYEMRVILASLLSRATIVAPKPDSEAMRTRNVTLTPARGGRIILRTRG